MERHWRSDGRVEGVPDTGPAPRLVADGGGEDDVDGDDPDGGSGDESDAGDAPGLDRSNVEVTDAGESDPVDPKWEKPDPDDIPEFEVRSTGATTRSEEARSPDASHGHGAEGEPEDPTVGMPNAARSPADSRIGREGTEGYVAALELCARLPDDVRLPKEAADLVPAAVEAELERDVQSFAAAEFDNQSPHVDVLEFVEQDGEIWLRLRLGIPSESFADLDPEEIRSHALQELEGLL